MKRAIITILAVPLLSWSAQGEETPLPTPAKQPAQANKSGVDAPSSPLDEKKESEEPKADAPKVADPFF